MERRVGKPGILRRDCPAAPAQGQNGAAEEEYGCSDGAEEEKRRKATHNISRASKPTAELQRRSFHIPRKSREKRALFQNLSTDSREFPALQQILCSSYKDLSSIGTFVYSKPRLVYSEPLEKDFMEKRKELKQDGRTEKELTETFCFLLCDAQKVALVCERGLSVGSSWMNMLGNPSKGVYLSQFSDLLQINPFEPGSSGEIIIFKVIKGRVKSVHDSMARGMDPTPKFDSHFAKNSTRVTSLQSFRAFEFTQQYFYEYMNFEVSSRPRHVCPYAVISYYYKGKEASTVIPKPLLHQRSVSQSSETSEGDRSYTMWQGHFVNRGKEVYHASIRSQSLPFLPYKLPEKIEISRVMRLQQVKQKVPSCLFSWNLYSMGSREVSKGGMYCSLFDVEEKAKSPKSLFTLRKNLEEEDLVLVNMLKDGAFLFLLSPNQLLNSSNSPEWCIPVVSDADCSVVPKHVSFISALHHSLSQARADPPADLGATVELQLYHYLSNLHEGKPLANVKTGYDCKLDLKKKLFPAPRQKANWESFMRPYIFNPAAFTMLQERVATKVEELLVLHAPVLNRITPHDDPGRLTALLKEGSLETMGESYTLKRKMDLDNHDESSKRHRNLSSAELIEGGIESSSSHSNVLSSVGLQDTDLRKEQAQGIHTVIEILDRYGKTSLDTDLRIKQDQTPALGAIQLLNLIGGSSGTPEDTGANDTRDTSNAALLDSRLRFGLPINQDIDLRKSFMDEDVEKNMSLEEETAGSLSSLEAFSPCSDTGGQQRGMSLPEEKSIPWVLIPISGLKTERYSQREIEHPEDPRFLQNPTASMHTAQDFKEHSPIYYPDSSNMLFEPDLMSTAMQVNQEPVTPAPVPNPSAAEHATEAYTSAAYQSPALNTFAGYLASVVKTFAADQAPASVANIYPSKQPPLVNPFAADQAHVENTSVAYQTPVEQTFAEDQTPVVNEFAANQTLVAQTFDADQTPVANEFAADQTLLAQTFADIRTPVVRTFAADQTPVAHTFAEDQTPVANEFAADQTPVAHIYAENQIPVANEFAADQTPSTNICTGDLAPVNTSAGQASPASTSAGDQAPKLSTSDTEQAPAPSSIDHLIGELISSFSSELEQLLRNKNIPYSFSDQSSCQALQTPFAALSDYVSNFNTPLPVGNYINSLHDKLMMFMDSHYAAQDIVSSCSVTEDTCDVPHTPPSLDRCASTNELDKLEGMTPCSTMSSPPAPVEELQNGSNLLCTDEQTLSQDINKSELDSEILKANKASLDRDISQGSPGTSGSMGPDTVDDVGVQMAHCSSVEHAHSTISSIIDQLHPEMITNLVEILKGVHRNSFFYIHSLDEEEHGLCCGIKEYLKGLGNLECNPHSFLEKGTTQEKLLVIIQNRDIASQIHKIPSLVSLKKHPTVSFAGVDSLSDIQNHTYNELFQSGGFIVSDEHALNPAILTAGRLQDILQLIEKLNSPEHPWRWRVHFKFHKKLREHSRVKTDSMKLYEILSRYERRHIVEILSYHDCDNPSRRAPDLNCLVDLQARFVKQRHLIFLTGFQFEMFPQYSSSGFVVANVEDIQFLISSLASGENVDLVPAAENCPIPVGEDNMSLDSDQDQEFSIITSEPIHDTEMQPSVVTDFQESVESDLKPLLETDSEPSLWKQSVQTDWQPSVETELHTQDTAATEMDHHEMEATETEHHEMEATETHSELDFKALSEAICQFKASKILAKTAAAETLHTTFPVDTKQSFLGHSEMLNTFSQISSDKGTPVSCTPDEMQSTVTPVTCASVNVAESSDAPAVEVAEVVREEKTPPSIVPATFTTDSKLNMVKTLDNSVSMETESITTNPVAKETSGLKKTDGSTLENPPVNSGKDPPTTTIPAKVKRGNRTFSSRTNKSQFGAMNVYPLQQAIMQNTASMALNQPRFLPHNGTNGLKHPFLNCMFPNNLAAVGHPILRGFLPAQNMQMSWNNAAGHWGNVYGMNIQQTYRSPYNQNWPGRPPFQGNTNHPNPRGLGGW
ncbi:hypothetical protein DNTS_001090 [Danionella cerebrum]|uniref:Uncharacterized protein n=1 Tax=Danionella cerebrum TaxID=2873325 RepID=A0A553RFH8_9TELE|nr:hypothetical protein DNTS_001090 [Danionella translucida]